MDTKGEEKKGRLLEALDQGMAMIHLDARRPGVIIPQALKTEGHLRLNLSYRFDPPDLAISPWGVRATLSFSGQRFLVAVPWSALFAISSYATKEFWIYPDDMPPELVQAGPARASKGLLREVGLEAAGDGPPENEPPRPVSRGHLRVVK